MGHPRCIVGNKPQRVALEVFKRFQVHPKRDQKYTATNKNLKRAKFNTPSPPTGPMQRICDAIQISNRALRPLLSDASAVIKITRGGGKLTEHKMLIFIPNDGLKLVMRKLPRLNAFYEPTNSSLSTRLSGILGQKHCSDCFTNPNPVIKPDA